MIARGKDFGGEADEVEETDVGVEGPLLSTTVLGSRWVASLSVVIDTGGAVVVVVGVMRSAAPGPASSPPSFAPGARAIDCCCMSR